MSFGDFTQWQSQWLEAQQRQLAAYEQWFGAGTRIVEAQRKGLEATEELIRVQMRMLTMWGL